MATETPAVEADNPVKTSEADPFREAVDNAVGDSILVELGVVAQVLGLPSRESVRRRIKRGLLPLRAITPGGRTAQTLVPAADLYALLGLAWKPPAGPAEVLAHVMPDGSVRLTNNVA